MRVEGITNNNYSKISSKGNFTTAAIISAMMASHAPQAQELKADTFEYSPKTEYVQAPADLDSTYVVKDTVKGNKERGNEFNNWVSAILSAADDNGKLDTAKLNGTPADFALNENETFLELANSIVASYDNDGDGEINFDEYIHKTVVDVINPVDTGKANYQKYLYHRNLDNVFFGFDINDKFSKKYKNKNTYTDAEIAANLYAMSRVDYDNRKATMKISGQELLDELNHVIKNGYTDTGFGYFQKESYEYFFNSQSKEQE